MIRILATSACALCMAFAAPAHAQDDGEEIVPSQAPCIWVDDGEGPLEVVRALYDPAPRDDWSSGECATLGETLGNAFIEDAVRMRANDDPIGRLDFDFIVNGQDALITEVEASEYKVEYVGPDDPERMVITVSFKNFDSANTLDYYWVKQEDAWALEEVVARSPGFEWVLSLLLKYGR